MVHFQYKDKIYSYIPYESLKLSDLPKAKRAYKSKYLDLDCAFDIETSSYQDDKKSWLYMWQFAINDITIIGRTWSQFIELLNLLKSYYENDKKYRILCWVHNLSYEFSFMKNWLTFAPNRDGYPEVFALNPREVIKCVTSQNIEFRDSAVLTNVKLEKLAVDYQTGLEKLVEDIDYKQILTPATPLDEPRIAYSINDVQILAKFNKNYIKQFYFKQGHDVPLTSTAIVRNELKRNFKKLPKIEKLRYRSRIRNSFPNRSTYELVMYYLYRGGYVHSSIADTFQLFENMDMWSLDFKSSYPAVMLHENYPWRFVRRDPEKWYKIAYDFKYMKENAFYVKLNFTNIRAKTSHSIESKHKIIRERGGLYDNGRLVKADKIEVMLTEQDWLNYLDFYSWDKVECESFFIASKEPLPKFLLDMVLEYFNAKETLNRDTLDYLLMKMKLNSLYGMCVAGLFHSSLIFKDGIMQPSGDEKDYQDIVRSQILLPWWGIWVCAYARRNLLKIVAKLDEDNAYSDTDSSKVFNYYGNKYIFDNYNDRIHRMNDTMYVGSYDRKIFRELGTFCVEDKYLRFQANGAKKYIYTTASKVKDEKDPRYGKYILKDHVTVAGMRKGSLEEKARNEDIDIYELFQDGLTLDKLESKKLTSSYCDDEFTFNVTDYMGNTSKIYERSCITLIDIGFKMNIANDYIQLYNQYKEKEALMVGRRF